MKTLLFLVALLYQYQNVKCVPSPGFFSYIYDAITNSLTCFTEDVYNVLVPDTRHLHRPIKKHFKTLEVQKKEISKTRLGELIHYLDRAPDKPGREQLFTMANTELVTLHGKIIEIHKVKTKDGYILSVHRVVMDKRIVSNNRTVLLHHGLLGSSADWVMLGPTKALPYMLTNAGYDVWMTNARGNHYSKHHVALSADDPEFWKFTWQEIGTYDLPAVLEYIEKKKVNNEKITFIGHSMGATAFFVLLSTVPCYNHKLHMAILLAPLVQMRDARGPLRALAAINITAPNILLDLLGHGELLPDRRMPKMLTAKFCKQSTLFCSNPLFFFAGGMKTALRNPERTFLTKLLTHVPAGGSTHSILHYMQILKTGRFNVYNQFDQIFDLSNITLPIALFSSGDDIVAPTVDAMRLYSTLLNPVAHIIIREMNITHTEFVWGTDAHKIVFKKIVKLLDNSFEKNITSNEVKLN